MIKEKSFNYKKSRIRLAKNEEEGIDVPLLCKVCDDAPCIEICPTQAIVRDPSTRAIVVFEEQCIGCNLCGEVCPIGAISIGLGKSVATVCDQCRGEPLCVRYCPTEALVYEEPDVVASRRRTGLNDHKERIHQ
jgi:carbon-monoxide dehydrogenase iron sulfur subunit